MIRLFALMFLLPVIPAHAAGFTWLSSVAAGVGLEEHSVTFILVALILITIGAIYRSRLLKYESSERDCLVPDNGLTLRNVIDAYGEWILGLTRSIIGDQRAKLHYNFVASVFLIIFISNLMGLIPGFLPPTDNLNTTLAMGLFVFIYYNWQGIRVQGLVGHIKHFMGPIIALAPLMFIIELVSHCVRPVSLGLRLRGNMSGDHIVLGIFSDLVPLFVPVIFLGLGLFISFVQAFVFTLLTVVYIGLATEEHHHPEHDGAH